MSEPASEPMSQGAPAKTTTGATWVLVLTSAASLMVALDLLVVSTALSTIRADLGAPVEALQWTATAYGLPFAVLLMTGAALGDRFGRRRVFVLGLAVFTTASAGCALAPDVGWLIATRAVQGVGAALVMPLGVALLSASVTPERRGRAFGIFEGITGLATIAGPVVGGVIAQTWGWQWIFWVNVPIGLVVMALAVARIEDSRGPDRALDLRGLVLVTAGATGLVWALGHGTSGVELAVALTAGILLLGVFVAWQRRAANPMLPPRLFRSATFSGGLAASFLLFASLYGAVFFLGQFMQNGLGHSPAEAGLRLVPWTATLLVIAPLAGVVADRAGNRPVLVGGLALQAIGMGWLAAVARPDVAYPELLVPLLVAGVGASMAIPVVQNVVLGAVAEDDVGKAAGGNSMVQELGGVVGIATLVTVFTATGGPFTDGFTAAMVGSALFSAAGVVAALWTRGCDI